jgi:hypothetical protein
MVEQTFAPVSRVDIEKLYVDDLAPESWLELELRVVELLDQHVLSERQSQAMVYGLRTLAARGNPVPSSSDDLYLAMRPVLEELPDSYA